MQNNTTTQSPQNKKVGVVIPIYNVAEYLRECLDSVINQTYKNLSIVLVNDGSTDNDESLNIAKEYVAKDSRFILIDKENGGQSTARNVGIAWFSEKYETKLDSSVDLESHVTYAIDSATQNKTNQGFNSGHVEYSETSNMGSKRGLDSKTDPNSNKDILPVIEKQNNQQNLHSNDKAVKFYTYNITNENPYNIYRIYTNGNTTQNIESTNPIHTTIAQQEAHIEPKTLESKDSAIHTDISNDNPNYPKEDTRRNIESKSLEAQSLQPQKIDYIIFLDSDDYWKPNAIEECIKHSEGVDIVWFDFLPFYRGNNSEKKWGTTMQEHFEFQGNTKLSGREWLERCIKKNINSFYFTPFGLIDFIFLKTIKLYFLDGVIYEDHNFGCLLFLQSKNIYVLTNKIYLYRIREHSTTNKRKNTPVPHYARHIYDAFDNKETAKQYHKQSCFFLMFLEFLEFLEKQSNKDKEAIGQHFMPFYAAQCESLITCECDPLNIVNKIHVIEPYLKKGFRYRYRLYMKNKILYKLLNPIFVCYDSLKSIERTIRRTLKNTKKQ